MTDAAGSEAAGDAGRRTYARSDWIAIARTALIEGGIAAVKVDRLAALLEITRGGFYWHFTGRADLLDALLDDWEGSNTEPMLRAVAAAGDDGEAQFRALLNVWIGEEDFSPAYDSAVREWARASADVAARVRAVDRRRLELIARIFRRLGFSRTEAMVRARVTYYHQVGYYVLSIHETRQRREKLYHYYTRILIDRDIEP